MTHIGQFINRYFKYQMLFAANDMDEQFSHIVSATGKKRDIDSYLSRLGQYLKQWRRQHKDAPADHKSTVNQNSSLKSFKK